MSELGLSGYILVVCLVAMGSVMGYLFCKTRPPSPQPAAPVDDVPERITSIQEYTMEFDRGRTAEALKNALEMRKFEIEMYWKRSTYFWTFIGLVFAGYGACLVTDKMSDDLSNGLTTGLACLGFVLSLGWFFASKGSKQWQENWENHVDLLEDSIMGPLHKVVFKRMKPDAPMNCITNFVTGPSNFSVSRIDHIISLYTVCIWGTLLIRQPFRFSWSTIGDLNIVLAVLAWASFLVFGRTHGGNINSHATVRSARLRPPS